MNIDDLHKISPYSLEQREKEAVLSEIVIELCRNSYRKCSEYARIVDFLGIDLEKIHSYYQLPFLPVRLFKQYSLTNINEKDVFKTMTSSGTTGQSVSKVYLDKENALLQQKVLLRILSDIVDKKRRPMLIVDSPDVVTDRKLFSARGAALMSISMMGRNPKYVLNSDMSLNFEVLSKFLEENGDVPNVMFGMTFMVWKHFYQELIRMNKKVDMKHTFLVQSGGWKKLQDESVSREMFKENINAVSGITHFSDHYSMAEQNGSVYAECEYGHYHASIYSDVIIRDEKDFSVKECGEEGIVQVVSCLPHSYPGNSLLTEDIGMIEGVDDCPCGRKGKYIKILGRMKNAEIRGCSDTYATKY